MRVRSVPGGPVPYHSCSFCSRRRLRWRPPRPRAPLYGCAHGADFTDDDDTAAKSSSSSGKSSSSSSSGKSGSSSGNSSSSSGTSASSSGGSSNGWTCPDDYRNDGSCDCGCGATDPDCLDSDALSCELCWNCGTGDNSSSCFSHLDSSDNSQCL